MEALGLFNQAKSTESDNPLLHYYMASALMKLNQKADAIREYKMALLLSPKGKIAEYCEASLRGLGASDSAPPPSSKKGSSVSAMTKRTESLLSPDMVQDPKGKIKLGEANQQPQVISIVCGCTMCHRADLMITDLHTKYGDQINFIRVMKSATDQKSRDIIDRFESRKDPTIVLINSHGSLAGQFYEMVSEADLRKDIDDLAKDSPRRTMNSLEDKKLQEMRDAFVNEAEARISHDQIRVEVEIKQVETEMNQQIQDIPHYSQDRSQQIEQIKADADRKIKFLNDDLEKRKKEAYKYAQDRIKALEATASYSKQKNK